jgi:hypothetical protein
MGMMVQLLAQLPGPFGQGRINRLQACGGCGVAAHGAAGKPFNLAPAAAGASS